MKNLLTTIVLCCTMQAAFSQCTGNVPTITIDLSADPNATWVMYQANAPNRLGQCCGASTSQNCIKFIITLHPAAAGIFFDYDGAGAFGSLNWKVDCGPAHNLKDTICITNPGPFTLTFCKGGNDNGNYSLISIPKPTFPQDQFLPRNCIQPVEVLGVSASTVTWQSISPGTPGQYNSNLSCTNCLTPTFTPFANSPNEIQYRVCGYPILKACLGNVQFCDTVKFTIQDSLKISISPQQPSFCAGGSALLTAQATGGDGAYNYIWYNSSLQVVGTGPTFSATTTGNYSCEVRDGNYEAGYCGGFTTSVTVVQRQPPTINAGPDQVLCASSPNAMISGTVQNANNILWSGGTGTFLNGNTVLSNQYIPSSNDIQNGSVTLTLSTVGVGGGCSNVSDQVQLFYIDTIKTNLTDNILLCKYGSISVNPTITGGLAPLTYSWSNGTTTASNTLGEGTFCLNIVDANNCQTTKCISILSPSSIDIIPSSTPASTNGGSDGTASVSASGGIPPYSYLWSNGGTTATITNLSYGVYTVTLTDANGCERTGSVVVNEPQCNGFNISTSSTDVSCFNGTNGTTTATINGGTAPFNIQWDDPLNQTSLALSNLSAGVYTITVSDASACVSINTAIVNEPDPMNNTTLTSNVSVVGGNDGQAQTNVFGGVSGYTFLWSNGATNPTISNLTTGWYIVSIADANNCQLMDSVFISEPPCTDFQAMINSTSSLCNGLATGTATVSLVNGTAPYSINWSTGQTDVFSINALPAGFHSVEVTDSIGCMVTQLYGINEPAALSVGLSPTPSTCFGSNNGTIDASVNGGTYPYYSYNWSNGGNSEDLINLISDSYTLTVTDQNGCTASATTTVTQPAKITISNTHQNVTCFDYTDGWIDVNVVGGTMPFVYNWSNGATTQDLSGIDVGGYILNITDANYCQYLNAVNILIDQPIMVTIDDLVVSCPVPGEVNTLVSVTPSGGNSGYSVSFDNGLSYSAYGTFQTQLPVDAIYDIIVMDSNNCLSDTMHIDIDSTISVSSVNFNMCYVDGQLDETVTVNIQGGSPSYSFSTDNGATFLAVGQNSEILPINSSYQIVAMDQNGCVSEIYPVQLPDPIVINGFMLNPSCFGDVNGSVNLEITGGSAPYNCTWSNGSSLANLNGLSAGNYTLTLTDQNNCTETQEFILFQPNSLVSDLYSPLNFHGNNISLSGGSDGQIDASVSGGTSPYSYSWSNNSESNELDNLTAGLYMVTITDANGCKILDSIKLTQPNELELPTIFTPNQDGENDFFDIHGIDAYPNNKLIVVNRWGNVVFEEEKYNNTWKGTHKNGEELPDGVYFVILKINNDQIERNTYVHIKRF